MKRSTSIQWHERRYEVDQTTLILTAMTFPFPSVLNSTLNFPLSLSFLILKFPTPSESHLLSLSNINFPRVINSVVSFSSPAPSTSAVDCSSNAAAGVSSAADVPASAIDEESEFEVGRENDDVEAGMAGVDEAPKGDAPNLNVPPPNVGAAPNEGIPPVALGAAALPPKPLKALPPPKALPNADVGFESLSLLVSISPSASLFLSGVDPKPNPILAEPNPTGFGGEPEPKAPTLGEGDLGTDGVDGKPSPIPKAGVLGAGGVQEGGANGELGTSPKTVFLGAVSFAMLSEGLSLPKTPLPPKILDELEELVGNPAEPEKGFGGAPSAFEGDVELEGGMKVPPLPKTEVADADALAPDANALPPKVPPPKEEDEENGEDEGGVGSDFGLAGVGGGCGGVNGGSEDFGASKEVGVEGLADVLPEPNVNEEGGVTDGTNAGVPLAPFVDGE